MVLMSHWLSKDKQRADWLKKEQNRNFIKTCTLYIIYNTLFSHIHVYVAQGVLSKLQ